MHFSSEKMKLETKRIRIRFLQPSDAKKFVPIVNDETIFRSVPYPYTLSRAKEFIARNAKNYKKKKPEEISFAVERTSDCKIMGVVSILRIQWPFSFGELGYWLGKEFRGKGYMREACKLALWYAFKRLRLNRVEIICAKTNPASENVIRSLGAKFEGILRERAKDGKKHTDACIYSILRREFHG